MRKLREYRLSKGPTITHLPSKKRLDKYASG